ncbi:MAG: alpha/beta hydrolase [Anaerolineales bacterium]
MSDPPASKTWLRSHLRLLIPVILGVLLLILLIAGAFWLANPYQPLPEAQTAMVSDSVVRVHEEPWLIFEPRTLNPTAGLILYPGGRVAPEAYAPTARALAEQGNLVVIVPMPLNLAVLAPNAAAEVIEQMELVQHWAIGGHSLGGAMAARFADNNPDLVDGLVLWASYPARSNDLSRSDLAVVSVFASADGLAGPQEVLASAPLLPSDARFVEIDGGNHAQFGWYGPQSGDGQADISLPAQQQVIIDATSDLLEGLSSQGAPPLSKNRALFSNPFMSPIHHR